MSSQAVPLSVESNGGQAPPAIVFLPEGEHLVYAKSHPQGKFVSVDRSCLAGLQASLERMKSGNVRPVLYFNHEVGAAAALPSSLDYVEGIGLVLFVEWTEEGKKAVEGKTYSYFSPHVLIDSEGRPVSFVEKRTEIGSLTNEPAFRTIHRIAASAAPLPLEARDDLILSTPVSRQDEKTKQKKQQPTSMIKLVECGLLTASEAQEENACETAKAKVSELKKKADQADSTQAELDATKEEVEALKASQSQCVASLVDKAVLQGKIAPKDEATKKFWTNALAHDVLSASAALDKLPVVEALNTPSKPKEETEQSLVGYEALSASIAEDMKTTNQN